MAALLVAALAAGAVASATTASSDPNWDGSDPILISHGSADEARRPAIAVNSLDEVAVVWSDPRTGDNKRDIYFTEYNLSAWSAPQAITTTQYHSLHPDLLAVGDRFFAAWVEPDADKVFATELGSGVLSALPSGYGPSDSGPSLAATPGKLHMVASVNDSYGITDLYYASRPLASASWTPLVSIYESPALGAWWPAMAASPDGLTLHLVWEERSPPSNKAVNYISGTVSGGSVTWSTTPVVLSAGLTQSAFPDIAVDADGNVHVIWTEIGTYEYDEQYVRYRRLAAGSSSWSPSQRIDPERAKANQVAPTYVSANIATWTDGESGKTTVCAAWHGFRDGDPTAEEALLTCSPNGGNTWNNTLNMSRSTTPEGADEVSIRPDIAFDSSGELHVAWQEYSGGTGGSLRDDYEIYYAYGGVASGPVYLPLVLRNH